MNPLNQISPQNRLNHARKFNAEQQQRVQQLKRRINHISLQDDRAYKTYNKMEVQLEQILNSKQELDNYKQLKQIKKERELKELEDRKEKIQEQKRQLEQAKSFRTLQMRQQRLHTGQMARNDREQCHQEQNYMLLSLDERLQQITCGVREFHKEAEERRKDFFDEVWFLRKSYICQKRRQASSVYKRKTFNALLVAQKNIRTAEELERVENQLLHRIQASQNLYKQTMEEFKQIQNNDGELYVNLRKTPVQLKQFFSK